MEKGNSIYDSREGCNAIIETATNTLLRGCKNTIIPNGVTSIGSSAFESCSALASITIPSSVTSIGESAFNGCSGLTSVTIPSIVTSIGGRAFYGCSGLTLVTIPGRVTSIGGSAFDKCENLKSVTINSNTIASKTYREFSSFANIFGSQVEKYVFVYYVQKIGKYACAGCSSLITVTIPSSVTSIGEYAFLNCSSLASVTIPYSVTSIGSSAFDGCKKLESVTIGKGVTSIGSSAFRNCKSLPSITCYAITPPTVNSYTFDGFKISSATLHVPTESVNKYKSDDHWKNFGSIVAIE